MNRWLLTLVVILTMSPLGFAAEPLSVVGGKVDVVNAVVVLPLPKDAPKGTNAVELADGSKVMAQVGTPDLTDATAGQVLRFVLPKLNAGQTLTVKPSVVESKPIGMKFVEEKGQHVDLVVGEKKVLRYMNMPHDKSTKDQHELTFKPFHHVFDPVKGETLLTNGAGLAANKELMFPHHRGIYFGWMRISYGQGQVVDNWHGRDGVYTQHEKMLMTEVGEVVGRHRAEIGWYGKDGLLFAEETRELDAYPMKTGTLIEFESIVKTQLPKVTLDGDPQHAGFHFRAAMETAKKYAPETYYLRPDGKDANGKTRNWDPKTKAGPVNLLWNAMCFKVGGERYTAVYLDHPTNPKEARYSERDYGRFGSYFVYDITPKTPLKVKYRLWIQAGEMTQQECENLSANFVNPPTAK
jgi:Methane oxygenase PmoA